METLNIQKELRDRIGDIKNEKEGRLIVGCGENLSAYILPLVMPVFLKNNPKSQIKLIEANASTFENLIKSGKMDLAFTGTPIENPGLESAFLYSEEVLLLVPKKYRVPSAGKSKTCGFPFCDMTALKEMPFILFKPGRYLRHIADKIFEDHHIRPKIFLETNNWATCFRMVEEGMACTFLPHLPLREFSGNGQIERFSVKGGYVRHISICYKKKRYQSRLMQKFIETAGITIKEVLPTSDLLLESVMPQNKI
jgi:DNA-binding transcriptional LysR family regulator